MIASLAAAADSGSFVDLDVEPWHWAVLLGVVLTLLLFDLLVLHRKPHEIKPREAAIESAVWVSIGLGFSLVVWWWFGGAATTEYLSGYLVEQSLSVDNVFVWAIILTYFAVPAKYQHRVLFWGIFGALVLRATFIFAGVALIERFDWVLYVFGAFLRVHRDPPARVRATTSRSTPATAASCASSTGSSRAPTPSTGRTCSRR